MQTKNLLLFVFALLLFSCNKESTPQDIPSQKEPVSREAITQLVEETLRQGQVFNWESVDDFTLWSAGHQSDGFFAIGYTLPEIQDIKPVIKDIKIDDPKWTAAKEKIFDVILDGERQMTSGKDIQAKDILPFGQPKILPNFTVKITNPATITKLRGMKEVRYVEASGFNLSDDQTIERSNSGCGNNGPASYIWPADYTNYAPWVKVPWNFQNANIPNAWNQTSGNNVKVCIIDTGGSDNQDNLGSPNNFNSGYSQNRTVQKKSTLYHGWWWWRKKDAPHDQCGHGTATSGLATAPRGNDGNAVGVAYNSDLVVYRAVEDVIISTSNEREGVRDALIDAALDSDVRIISMSIGTPFWSSTVADGVYFANAYGKMIFAAAGTSTSWTSWYPVIFPANMSQTVAVTGAKEGSPLTKCTVCHDGSQVDFTLVMERSSNSDRTMLALSVENTNTPTYFGGSSCATATVAGIAALVWSKNTSLNKTQVKNKLIQASSNYPYKDSDLGWGTIDAFQAVNSTW